MDPRSDSNKQMKKKRNKNFPYKKKKNLYPLMVSNIMQNIKKI